jgi:hypothetical protein
MSGTVTLAELLTAKNYSHRVGFPDNVALRQARLTQLFRIATRLPRSPP